jgi:hypothetical protein
MLLTSTLLAALLALSSSFIPSFAQAFPEETPGLAGDHATLLTIEKASGSIFAADVTANQSRATQLAWGPGPDPSKTYLYVASNVHGVRRLEYDAAAGALSNRVDVVPTISGNGIAFHTDDLGQDAMYLVDGYVSGADSSLRLSRLWRIIDADGDGVFASGGDVSAVIVWGVPRDDHGLNHLQIRGDSLFLGSGVRTRNGAVQTFSGDTYGESAYGGAILTIDDLNAVATAANAAGFAAYPEHPDATTYAAAIGGTTAGSELPFTTTASDRLRVHSAGTRNPFGLAFDPSGALWFTVNFHRSSHHDYDRSVLDASAEGDAFQGSSNDDIHDQVFRAAPLADYGYRNSNWQNDTDAQAAGFFAGVADPTQLTPAHAFDNLDLDGSGGPDLDSLDPAWDALHVPASPEGLGPSSALTGLDFCWSGLPPRYHVHAFLARWNGQNGIIDGLDYRDVVLVHPVTGAVERVASGFNAPTDVLADAEGNLLVVSYYGSVWRIRSVATVPATGVAPLAGPTLLAVLFLLTGRGRLARRAPRTAGGRVIRG